MRKPNGAGTNVVLHSVNLLARHGTMARLRKRRRDVLLAILVPVLAVAGAEGFLRLARVYPMPPRRESVIHYQWVRSPLTRNFVIYDQTWASVDRHLREPPAPGVTRIFCFGGSVTKGWLRPEKSFPRQMADSFAADGHPEIEVYNFGEIGWSSVQALSAVQETIRAYHPSILVVYSGHNEMHEIEAMKSYFLPREVAWRTRLIRVRMLAERLRLVLLVEEAIKRLTPTPAREPIRTEARIAPQHWPVATAGDRAFAMAVYREDLAQIAALCRAKRVPLVLCTVATNLRADYPYPDPLPERERRIREAQAEVGGRNLAHADRLLNEAAAMGDVSGIHVVRGMIAEARGDRVRALAEYRTALDLSRPIRALSAVNDIVRETARRDGVPLLDVEEIVAARSPGGIIDNTLLEDHAHFTPEGNRVVAESLRRFLVERGWLRGVPAATSAPAPAPRPGQAPAPSSPAAS